MQAFTPVMQLALLILSHIQSDALHSDALHSDALHSVWKLRGTVGMNVRGEVSSVPIMVWVFSAVSTLNLLQEVAELLFVQLEVSDEARLLVQVEGQHGQRGAGSSVSKGKDVKLPVGLSILRQCKDASILVTARNQESFWLLSVCCKATNVQVRRLDTLVKLNLAQGPQIFSK